MADTRPSAEDFRVRIEKAAYIANDRDCARAQRGIALDLLVEILVALRRIEERPGG